MSDLDCSRPLPCFVCGVQLESVHGSGLQPHGGSLVDLEGTEGSTVFDPLNGESLVLTLCDDCLRVAGERGAIGIAHTWIPVFVDGVIWGSCRNRTDVPRRWSPGEPRSRARVEIGLDEIGLYAHDPDFVWSGGDPDRLERWAASRRGDRGSD